MVTREQMEVAGFRFTMEPAFESPLTMKEHQIFNEACKRWRKSVIHAMLPWSDGAQPQLVAVNGKIIDPGAAGVQADLQAPSATGWFPKGPAE